MASRRRPNGVYGVSSALTRSALTRSARWLQPIAENWLFGAAPLAFPFDQLWTGYWRANYSATPWPGNASAGNSAGRNLEDATWAPIGGTAVNGFTPASFFNSGGNPLRLTAPTGFLVDYLGDGSTSTGWTISVLVRLDAYGADKTTTPYYDQPLIVGSEAGNLTLCVTDTGIQLVAQDSGAVSTTPIDIAVSLGSYVRVQAQWTSTQVRMRVNGGAWQSTALTSVYAADFLGSKLKVGANYANAATGALDGEMLEFSTSDQVISDATLNALNAYYDTRYALGTGVIGTGATVFGRIVSAGIAKVNVTAAGSAVLGRVVNVGLGTVPVVGTGSAVLSTIRSAGTASVPIVGVGSVTFGYVPSAGSGIVGSAPITGTGSTVLGYVASAGTATAPIAGTGIAVLGRIIANGNATAAITGVGSTVLANVYGSGIGSSGIAGTGATTLGYIAARGNAAAPVTGTGSTALGRIASTGSAGVIVRGTGSAIFGRIQTAGFGSVFVPAAPVILRYGVATIAGRAVGVKDLSGRGRSELPVAGRAVHVAQPAGRATGEAHTIGRALSIAKVG